MQFDVNIRLYEYLHEQVRIRKKRWNNKEVFNIAVDLMLKHVNSETR
jgi:hypothetical protein